MVDLYYIVYTNILICLYIIKYITDKVGESLKEGESNINNCCESECVSHSVMSHSLQPHGL